VVNNAILIIDYGKGIAFVDVSADRRNVTDVGDLVLDFLHHLAFNLVRTGTGVDHDDLN